MSETRQLVRLVGILGRLDSPFDGERAAAGLLASRAVRTLGTTWEELIVQPRIGAPRRARPASRPQTPPPPASEDWRELVLQCLACDSSLTVWERSFLRSINGFVTISGKQLGILAQIAERLGVAFG